MVRAAPHYLLLTESHFDEQRATGFWKFVLQEIEGPGVLEVVEPEPGVDGERLALLSVLRGLEALDQPSSVTLITASRYVERGFRRGLPLWRETDWQRERFGAWHWIKNHDLWQRIDRALQYHAVECRCLHLDSSRGQDSNPCDLDDDRALAAATGPEPADDEGWQNRPQHDTSSREHSLAACTSASESLLATPLTSARTSGLDPRRVWGSELFARWGRGARRWSQRLAAHGRKRSMAHSLS